MWRIKIILIMICMCVLFQITALSETKGKTNLIFILDASGSMWGQIADKAKIRIAREAIDDIVNGLPEEINVGLVAYGHRTKGDCDDVETLIPLGPINKQLLIDTVKVINPKGKTPMYRSLKKTVESLNNTDDETTILLISDGKETCDSNPCQLVGELKKTGVQFVLHIVGFDVKGDTETQLKCMAEAGGGDYFPAKDSNKLKKALNTVVEKTVIKNLKVSVFLNGKPIGGEVEVIDSKTGQSISKRFSSEKRPIMLSVTPGEYTVKVADPWIQDDKPQQLFENVTITNTETQELTAHFKAGTLKIIAVKNGKAFKAQAKIIDEQGNSPGGMKPTIDGKPSVFTLQPGKYRILVSDSWGTENKIQLNAVDVAAGETVTKSVSFDSGKLVVWLYKNGTPFHGRVKVYSLDENNADGVYGTTYEDKPATFELNPGKYKVEAEDSWGSRMKIQAGEVDVTGGKSTEKSVHFESGKVEIWINKNGKPYHARVKLVNKNDDGEWKTTYEDSPANFEKQPGMYQIIAEDSWGNPVNKMEFGTIELKASDDVKKTLELNSPPA